MPMCDNTALSNSLENLNSGKQQCTELLQASLNGQDTTHLRCPCFIHVPSTLADAQFHCYMNAADKKRKVLGNSLAQDVLEFGGTITRAVIYKNRKKNAKKESFNIKPRPHVFVARERLFKGNTKNQKRFLASQQYLIDRGYIK